MTRARASTTTPGSSAGATRCRRRRRIGSTPRQRSCLSTRPRRSSLPGVSEYERVDRTRREPTVEDVRQLSGASTPHFALQIRNRIQNLVADLPPDHPARIEGEREIQRLNEIAYGAEDRGGVQEHERPLPSLELAEVVEEPPA